MVTIKMISTGDSDEPMISNNDDHYDENFLDKQKL